MECNALYIQKDYIICYKWMRSKIWCFEDAIKFQRDKKFKLIKSMLKLFKTLFPVLDCSLCGAYSFVFVFT